MKVKCVETDGNGAGLEKGKIYEGELRGLSHEKRWEIKGLEDWSFFEYRFEEIKKDKTYICIDNSGSMDSKRRREIIKIIDKYMSIEDNDIELIKYTTIAGEISYDDYKNGNMESGGTYISSGLKMVFDKIIELKINDKVKKYSNINVLVLSDGENWSEDNHKTEFLIEELKNMGAKIKLYDILPSSYTTPISTRLIKNGIISNEELEVIKEPTKNIDNNEEVVILKIKQEVNDVSVSILQDSKVIAEGVAKCLPEDTFDKNVGIILGLMKALEVSKTDMLTIFSDREILDKMYSIFS